MTKHINDKKDRWIFSATHDNGGDILYLPPVENPQWEKVGIYHYDDQHRMVCEWLPGNRWIDERGVMRPQIKKEAE